MLGDGTSLLLILGYVSSKTRKTLFGRAFVTHHFDQNIGKAGIHYSRREEEVYLRVAFQTISFDGVQSHERKALCPRTYLR